MKRAKLKIVKSTHRPDCVSIRHPEDEQKSVRQYLTDAGFMPGDLVVVLPESEYDAIMVSFDTRLTGFGTALERFLGEEPEKKDPT